MSTNNQTPMSAEESDLAFAQAARDAVEIAELKAHIAALETAANQTIEQSVYLKRLEVYSGQCDIELQSEIIPMMATYFARFFDIQGAENNFTFQFKLVDDAPDQYREFEISIQKVTGKTLAFQNKELRAQVAALQNPERDRKLMEAAIAESALCIARGEQLDFAAIIKQVDGGEGE